MKTPLKKTNQWSFYSWNHSFLSWAFQKKLQFSVLEKENVWKVKWNMIN